MKTRKDMVDDWNVRTTQLIKERNEKMADYCEEHLLAAKSAYYAGTPIMDDEAFDMLESSLKILRPNSKILEKIGG